MQLEEGVEVAKERGKTAKAKATAAEEGSAVAAGELRKLEEACEAAHVELQIARHAVQEAERARAAKEAEMVAVLSSRPVCLLP